MNIEKLAKHLKEFTIDEIEMIAECDCKTILKHLLNTNKIVFEQNVYKYIEKPSIDYQVVVALKANNVSLNFETAVKYFLENYAKRNCTKRTYETYESIFRVNILPFFRNKNLEELTNEDIKVFYQKCKNRNLGVKRLKNTLALLNQLIKYFQEQGMIDRKCNFQVKRVSRKALIGEINPLCFLSL